MIEHLTETYELTDDMSYLEEKEIFLESTSSMVFDRVNRIVYAGISPRTNAVQLIIWCRNNDFELVLFETESHTGSPIYHTDVLMYVGTDIIGICFDVIKEEHRDYVKKKVAEFHDVVELTAEQIENFCGNNIMTSSTMRYGKTTKANELIKDIQLFTFFIDKPRRDRYAFWRFLSLCTKPINPLRPGRALYAPLCLLVFFFTRKILRQPLTKKM